MARVFDCSIGWGEMTPDRPSFRPRSDPIERRQSRPRPVRPTLTLAMAHTPHMISRAEFARRADKTRSTITAACKGPLAAACGPRKRIDAAHPATVAWAESRGIDPVALTKYRSTTRTRRPRKAKAEPDMVEHDGQRYPRKQVERAFALALKGEIEDMRSQGVRCVPLEVEDWAFELVNIDHPCVSEWLSEQWGRPCTAEDLDRLWEASNAEIAAATEAA